MKKFLIKDKKLRSQIKLIENQHFVLKTIFKDFNFFILTRWNAFLKLKSLTTHNSKISIINKCLHGFNKKRFNKLTSFSRHVLLKLIRSGSINGMQKSSW